VTWRLATLMEKTQQTMNKIHSWHQTCLSNVA
jgi:hypothetical protein